MHGFLSRAIRAALAPAVISLALLTAPAGFAFAATVTLSPSAIGNYDDWSQTGGSGGSTSAKKVNAVSTDNGDTSYIHRSNSERQSFVVPDAGIPVGATINSVTVTAVAKGTGSGNKDFDILVENGTGSGNRSAGSTVSAASTYATSTRSMATNPFTGSAWTLSEVNAWSVRFGVERPNSSGAVRVTQLFVTVDYTPPGGLIVTKNTVGGDGTFSMSGDGGIGSFSIETSANTGSKSFSNFELWHVQP